MTESDTMFFKNVVKPLQCRDTELQIVVGFMNVSLQVTCYL